MPLQPCADCGNPVSDRAPHCPHCGRTLNREVSTPSHTQASRSDANLFGPKIVAFLLAGGIAAVLFHALGVTVWLHREITSFLRNVSPDAYRFFRDNGYAVLCVGVFFGWGDVGVWLVKRLHSDK